MPRTQTLLPDDSGSTSHFTALSYGACLMAEGGVLFRLWAPEAQEVALIEWRGGDRLEHTPDKLRDGWYQCRLPHAEAGLLYQWKANGDMPVPDPASRYNPDGPHGPSQVIDPSRFQWDLGWIGRPWSETVLYELHVGTFTPEGTYAAAEHKLDALVATGITAVELMPLSTFPGRFGWGYDGVRAQSLLWHT